MRGIVNTTLAVSTVETPTIAASGGQEMRTETGVGAAQNMESSFKKKLQDCQAMMGPDPQTAAQGSTTITEDGVQSDPNQTVSGIGSILEGFGVPVIPSGEPQTTANAAGAIPVPADGTADTAQAANGQAEGTPGQIAGTQNTTAGQSPVLTQDEILKTVGAYLDEAAETETAKPVSAMQTQSPQTAASPAEAPAPAETQAPMAQAVSAPAPGTANEQTQARGEGQTQTDAQPTVTTAETTVKPVTEEAVNQAPADKPDKAVQADAPDKAAQPVNTDAAVETPKAPVTQEAAPAAAAQTKASETSQYAKENVLRIVDKVSTHAAEGKYDFDVELKPDFMGKVSIKVTMEGDSIRMQIKTDDMVVKGMLTDQTTSLVSALKDKGITLTNVDVSYDNQASLSGQQQPFERGDGGSGRQSGLYYATQAETGSFEPAAESYGGYYVGNSSVEFLA